MGSHTRTRRHGPGGMQARDAAFLKENGYSRVPQIVQWLVTLRCPLSCPHCLAGGESEGTHDMPADVSRDLIDQVADMGVPELLVTGGEPLACAELGAVIERLAKRGLGWSLNTACLPSAEQRRAIEKHPPMFVAVSLDGPRETHDRFRGRDGAFGDALRSIRYFAGLPGCVVAAGTTVTAVNFGRLNETFGIVVESGASNWGIHLPVKEGRAAGRPDLFLSRRQLAHLLRFVAKKRNYFPVTMADEFGYCGDWEPLVRDLPLTCGAGRTQCVILPDGSVVPCTTLDRLTSAGNIQERPLREIWERGFAELRHWTPQGRCAKCKYTVACQGGCWLQRRHGTPCYRDVWHVPAALKSAAGIAVCLGALAGGLARGAERVDPFVMHAEEAVPRAGGGIEGWIVLWYGQQMGSVNPSYRAYWGRKPELKPEEYQNREAALRTEIDAGPTGVLAKDPAALYFSSFINGDLPKDIPGRTRAIRDCLKTNERSLALAALLWRSLAECCLDGASPEKRSAEERRAVRETLDALRKATAEWRKEIFEKKIDPYLARGREFMPYMYDMSKAARPIRTAWIMLTEDTSVERWGGPRGAKAEALEGYLDRHPYAEHMQLVVTGEKEPQVFGVHDLLTVGEKDMVVRASQKGKEPLQITLPANAELTYADLLRLGYEQNREKLDAGKPPDVRGWSPYSGCESGGFFPFDLVVARRRLAELEKSLPPQKDEAKKNDWRGKAAAVNCWLADFWMF